MPEEVLSTGWEPDVDSEDSILLAGVRSQADWVQSHAEAMGRRWVRWDDAVCHDTGVANDIANMVAVTAPPQDWHDLAERVCGFYADDEVPYLVMNPFPTPDLGMHGWQRVGHPPFMYRPAGGDGPQAPPELELSEASTDDDLADFTAALEEFFPSPGLTSAADPWIDTRGIGPGFRVFLGRIDGRTVATAATMVGCGVNHVSLISADPGLRGRGVGAAMTWAATTADPALPAVLVSSDLGRSVYDRLGYVSLMRWSLWFRPPQA